MSRVVVFDFDKTLTHRDTTFPFYLSIARARASNWWRVGFFAVAYVLAGIGVLTSSQLKHLGIRLFLHALDEEAYRAACVRFAGEIETNQLFKTYAFDADDRQIVVVTASFRDYVEPLFPSGVTVVGTEIQFEGGEVVGLKRHAHGEEKVLLLDELGVDVIDELYTDSIVDLPMAKRARSIYFVCGDDVHPCGTADEFEKLARR